MSRRKRRSWDGSAGIKADPAKDLFAYLFLMIMVFCFMLMMASHDIVQHAGDKKSPVKTNMSAGASLTRMDEDGIGRLVKQRDDIFIAYGSRLYSPKTDLEALRADGRIRFMPGRDKTEKQVLYIEESSDQKVLLAEYLEAFSFLSRQGVGVAFAERVHD